ncbi:uncharacterized protein LOC108914823 [Anoplophora glabripennis]|uniref:uncharacterized protein LOC108914823 n=1 Tax=Anoplophora glabripennis TaxID=217634 RepID=UPI000874E7FE|nr:uncharacterized protein LOC108914823 [Anoplophora glabripennis]
MREGIEYIDITDERRSRSTDEEETGRIEKGKRTTGEMFKVITNSLRRIVQLPKNEKERSAVMDEVIVVQNELIELLIEQMKLEKACMEITRDKIRMTESRGKEMDEEKRMNRKVSKMQS